MANLNELVTQLDSGITAEQYLHSEEKLSTCLTMELTVQIDEKACAPLLYSITARLTDQVKNQVMKKKMKKVNVPVSSYGM